MRVDLSLVLNVFLLVAVIVAISRVVKERRKTKRFSDVSSLTKEAEKDNLDDIIAVRKILSDDWDEPSELDSKPVPIVTHKPIETEKSNASSPASAKHAAEASVVLFLLAKDNRQFAGYELLQTLLAAGLRFGDGNLFHRHQKLNGQGPVLCSLAAATTAGTFDLQNIGAFSSRGLCLFMEPSGNPTIDEERFTIMLDTAKQLSEDLDAHLLDDNRQPFTENSLTRYYTALDLRPAYESVESA